MEDWARLHKTLHWKEGRSAHSIVDFILNRDGTAHLQSRLSRVLSREVSIRLIIPEKQIRFDGYGRGRFHDLAIYGAADSDKSLFVGLEAKVDEGFGPIIQDHPIIQDQLKDARKQLKGNPRSKAVARIKNLPARFSPNLSLDSMFDIRYQLVHGTAGTVSAKQSNGDPYDFHVFYVLVFKTSLYDEQRGEENHRDYQRFISRVDGSAIERVDVEAYLLTMDNKHLACIYEQTEIPSRSWPIVHLTPIHIPHKPPHRLLHPRVVVPRVPPHP